MQPGGVGQRLQAAWQAEKAIDRTQLVPAERHVRAVQVFAWLSIVALFVLGWGKGTFGAVAILSGIELDYPAFGPNTIERQLRDLAGDAVLVFAAAAVLVAFRRIPSPASTFPKIRPVTRWRTFFVSPVIVAVSFGLMGLANKALATGQSYPHPDIDGWPATLLYAVSGAMAGPMEELALLAVVVTVLRRAGYSWALVCVVAVAVRVPFHLYYGWGALMLTVWALAMVALYRRVGTALPIAAAHALWNFTGTPGFSEIGAWVKIGCALVGTVVLAIAIRRALDATRTTADTP